MIEYENLGQLNRPFFDDYRRVFTETLESGWYILGKRVEAFEKEFAAYNGSQFCSGVANGLEALVLALRAFDLPPQSEVLVPSNTYIATILAIVQAGLVPVLVEPDLATYNIDPVKIAEAITPRTKVLMLVHLYGKACDMNKIMPLVKAHGLKLVEDCAQAHGACVDGKKVGTFGEFGAFSFYPTKNLGALGDAGAITTNDAELDERIRFLRNYGSKVKYHNEYLGHNSRLDEMQAAFLSIKLKALDEINSHKQKLASIYFEGLKKDFILPVRQAGFTDVFHIFNVRHPARDLLRAHLLALDIKTEIHYPIPPHQQKAMRGVLADQSFPISEEIHQTTLSLPISFFHTVSDVEKVVEALNQF